MLCPPNNKIIGNQKNITTFCTFECQEILAGSSMSSRILYEVGER